MARADARPPLSRSKLIARDGERCWHCGTEYGLTIQHRAVRGHGGRNSAEHPANGILLCGLFNGALEQDARAAAWALEAGWKLSTHTDPTTVAVYDAWSATWWLLGDDYTKEPA